jgi:hypothetical protein
MTTKIKIELNHAGVEELLKSGAVRAVLHASAARIAGQAGPGFEASSTIGRRRALAMVWAETAEARRAEAETRRLTRSIDAGRG